MEGEEEIFYVHTSSRGLRGMMSGPPSVSDKETEKFTMDVPRLSQIHLDD